MKWTFEALHDPSWPSYLPLHEVIASGQLRSSNTIRVIVPMEKNTFQDAASALYNNLPNEIKIYDDHYWVTSKVQKWLTSRALSYSKSISWSFVVTVSQFTSIIYRLY